MEFVRIPYQRQRATWAPGGFIHRPAVMVDVIGPKGTYPAAAFADTGLDTTLISALTVRSLGVALEPPEMIRGIGGQTIAVQFGDVELELRHGKLTYRWRTRVGFYAGNRDLLGHEGFFDLFHVSFDGYRHDWSIKPCKGAPVETRIIT